MSDVISTAPTGEPKLKRRGPWYTSLYIQVITAITFGIALGHFYPAYAVQLKPLGDGFIALIRMVIAPIVFCNVVHGIASMSDMRQVGRVGMKALVYFEVVSTLALIAGLVVAELIQPGRGLDIDPAAIDPKAVADFVARAKQQNVVGFLLQIIPETFVGAFVRGNILQVLLVAILCGFAIANAGPARQPIADMIGYLARMFFGVIRIISYLAPLGALGAMSFTIGRYGIASLGNLAALIGTFYVTSMVFVIVVLGLIALATGFSIFRFLAYLGDELLIVLGTSSSETVMPQVMEKLERAGASKSVVGLVFPSGYSFNTDGSNIYITLCIVFLAQATNAQLSIWQLAAILAFAMITSKGGTGVSGGGFVTLAATLAAVPEVPIQALALLLGVDRFMSECRALTNVIGNAVATIVVSAWEGELDRGKLARLGDPP